MAASDTLGAMSAAPASGSSGSRPSRRADDDDVPLRDFIEAQFDSHREAHVAEARRLDAAMLAEARRIDALLLVASDAVRLASARAELTATSLAERVEATAKALAERVEATAKASALTVEATARTLSGRIDPLEQTRYEDAGRKGISAPMLLTIAGLAGGVVVFIIERLLGVP